MEISNWEYGYKDDTYKVLPNRNIDRPKTLVKYFSLERYIIHALKNHYLYFSHPLLLNDPFDSCIQFINLNEIDLPSLIAFYRDNWKLISPKKSLKIAEIEKLVKYYYEHEKEKFISNTKTSFWNMLFSNYGLCSFTSNTENVLMWGYYNNHEGFAIKFNRQIFNNKNVSGPFPMNYNSEYETIDLGDDNFKGEKILYLLNIKSEDWAYEDEWRFILSDNNLSIPDYTIKSPSDKRKVFYSPESIESITLGYRFFRNTIIEKFQDFKFSEKHTVKFKSQKCKKPGFKQKTELLNFVIENDISLFHIETKDDRTFNIIPKPIRMSQVRIGKEYLIEFI